LRARSLLRLFSVSSMD